MAKRGFGGGMMPGNMNNLLKQAQKMQENMQKMQAELEAKEIESSVGGGAVTVKVNGKKELIDINIKPEVVDPDDIEMLQDLVLSAAVISDTKKYSLSFLASIKGIFLRTPYKVSGSSSLIIASA